MLQPKSAILIVPYIESQESEAYQTVEKIFRLDISVDNILGVKILQSLAHLPYVVSCN